MVNTGRPSRGCSACKARHVKCDERRPRCARCERAGRKCEGYKSDFEANLRDETGKVVRRMHPSLIRSGGIQTLQTHSYEQQAIALFLDNFVLNPFDAKYSKGYLTALMPLLQTTKPDPLLVDIIKAVGFCYLATSKVDDSLAARAAHHYSRSLSRLHSQIDQNANSTARETMISVYLMGLYEMIMPPQNNVHPWLAHLQGLSAMVKARNKKTGSRPPGVKFFLALESSFDNLGWAIDDNTSVDGLFPLHSDPGRRDSFNDLVSIDALKCTEFSPSADDGFVSTSLDHLILGTHPILQSAPEMLRLSGPEARVNVQRLHSAALSQLSSIKAWPSRLPPSWKPLSFQNRSNSLDIPIAEAIFTRIDVYSDLHVAAVWNTYRITLLRLCDVIVQCAAYLNENATSRDETEDDQAFRALVQNTYEGICASVAFHIHTASFNRITKVNLNKSSKVLGGLFLIWPLYGGSILSIAPSEYRIWMRNELLSIGLSLGLAQAVILANTIDLQGRVDPSKSLIIAHGHTFMWSANMF